MSEQRAEDLRAPAGFAGDVDSDTAATKTLAKSSSESSISSIDLIRKVKEMEEESQKLDALCQETPSIDDLIDDLIRKVKEMEEETQKLDALCQETEEETQKSLVRQKVMYPSFISQYTPSLGSDDAVTAYPHYPPAPNWDVSCFDSSWSVASLCPQYPPASGVPAVSGSGSGLVVAVPSLRGDPVRDAHDTEVSVRVPRRHYDSHYRRVSPRPSPEPYDHEDPNTAIIIDGCNILKHGKESTGRDDWHLLDVAVGHFVICKFTDIWIFLPMGAANSTEGEKFKLRWRGKATSVPCPHGVNAGVTDDEWIILYAEKKIREGRRVRVISDDDYKEYVDLEWRKKNTGKFIFAGYEFLVKYLDMEVRELVRSRPNRAEEFEVGTTSMRSIGVDKFQ